GASTRTFTRLGTTRTPGQLVPFCSATLVSRVTGIPPTRHVNAPVRCRDGPITVPEATPVATPALSPLVSGTTVAMLCAGVPMNSTLYTAGTPIGPAATWG